MNASAIQTSDDEFGYNFESDDEELLLQLASNSSPPLKQSTDPVALGPAPSTAKKTISSFEASREIKASKEIKISQKYVYRSDAPAFGFVKKIEASAATTTQKQALSSTSSVNETVIYPDREHGLGPLIRALSSN